MYKKMYDLYATFTMQKDIAEWQKGIMFWKLSENTWKAPAHFER